MNENKIHCLPPVIGINPKVLILGSMPGKKSLEEKHYYANPRNQFWSIICELIHESQLKDHPFEERYDKLKEKHLALWDVFSYCEREGSLDASIKNESYNNIHELLENNPSIRAVALNGKKAFDGYNKLMKGSRNDVIPLLMPSTSPIPGKNIKTFEEKSFVWSELKKYIQ